MWDNSGFVSYKGFMARARFGELIYKKERKKVLTEVTLVRKQFKKRKKNKKRIALE
jgi:hypothetical protein